jgi:hypothetical protein
MCTIHITLMSTYLSFFILKYNESRFDFCTLVGLIIIYIYNCISNFLKLLNAIFVFFFKLYVAREPYVCPVSWKVCLLFVVVNPTAGSSFILNKQCNYKLC